MRPVILIAGDSFTIGQGCSDRDNPATQTFPMVPSEFAWSSLLEKDYPEYNIVNLAQPGSSNITICNSIHEYINNKFKPVPSLILFCSSFDGRILVQSDPFFSMQFGNTTVVSDWVIPANITNQSKDYATAKEFFIRHLYTSKYFANVSLACVWSIYGLCNKNNIKFAWNYPVGEDANDHGYLNSLEFCRHEAISDWIVANRPNGNKIYEAADGHANNVGHQGYYDKVIRPLFNSMKM